MQNLKYLWITELTTSCLSSLSFFSWWSFFFKKKLIWTFDICSVYKYCKICSRAALLSWWDLKWLLMFYTLVAKYRVLSWKFRCMNLWRMKSERTFLALCSTVFCISIVEAAIYIFGCLSPNFLLYYVQAWLIWI